jgi:hypothetical protein
VYQNRTGKTILETKRVYKRASHRRDAIAAVAAEGKGTFISRVAPTPLGEIVLINLVLG